MLALSPIGSAALAFSAKANSDAATAAHIETRRIMSAPVLACDRHEWEESCRLGKFLLVRRPSFGLAAPRPIAESAAVLAYSSVREGDSLFPAVSQGRGQPAIRIPAWSST